MHLILALLLMLCTTAEAFGPTQTKKEREGRSSSRGGASAGAYEAVLESFLNEDFAQSEKLAARFLDGKRRDTTDDVAYLRALSLMKLGRFPEARPVLKQLEGEAASAELREQAAYSLGDSYYFENKRSEADIYYREAVQKYPSYGEAEQVKRLLGLSRPSLTASASAPMPAHQFGMEESAVYSIQVGAFSRRRNAERVLNKLLRNRYDAYISPIDASKHFRVRVGHLADLEEARSIETRLKKDGYPTKIIP